MSDLSRKSRRAGPGSKGARIPATTTSVSTTPQNPASRSAPRAWTISAVKSEAGLRRLGAVLPQVSGTAELGEMEKAVRQEAHEHYESSSQWPASVRNLLDAIEARRVKLEKESARAKTNLNKTKQVQSVAPPADQGPLPDLPVKFVGVGFKVPYKLGDRAERDRFIKDIRSAKSDPAVKKAEAAFTQAVSKLPNAQAEFADVRKAFADKTPPAKSQLEHYKLFTKYSRHADSLYGSNAMKRVELGRVPRRWGEETEQRDRKYTLQLDIPPKLQSDRAVAVATHIANALHDNKVHGVDLRQVVKIKDDTNELYHLNIHIPNTKTPEDPPARIEVTLEAVKPDDAVSGDVVDLTTLDPELANRIRQTNGDEILNVEYDVREQSARQLTMRSKPWLKTEIDVLEQAVGRIPQEHLSLLSKMQFIRMEKLPGSAGLNAIAEYYPTEPPMICISDRVVDPNYGEYLHDEKSGEVLPGTVRKIIHEVGHAVSYEKWRQAAFKHRNGTPLTPDEANDLKGGQSLDAPTLVALDEFIAKGEYVTEYAVIENIDEKNRENARSELFAEAYSLWITDRSFMEKNHPRLAAYFAALKF